MSACPGGILAVIGKGSVAEIKFYIAVEVLGRVIVPIKEIVNGVPSNMRSPDLGAPVVDEVTIDPYTYAIRKAENAFWNPLKTSLTLKFEPVEGEDIGDTVNISNIEWDLTSAIYNLTAACSLRTRTTISC